MINENVQLNDHYHVKGGVLTSYALDFPFDIGNEGWCRPAVIVVPGGAYRFVSRREGEPVAAEFLARGFQAFVLDYRVRPDGVFYPEEMLELACAVDYVRKNAAHYNVNPDEIFAVGFSAGGHLVGSLSTNYRLAQEEYGDAIDPRLTAAGLIYPVISDRFGYAGTHENLFDGADDAVREAKLPLTRLDEQVSAQTAPAFLFSTCEDALVPSQNALNYALAMARNQIPYELHVYKNGPHGVSTAKEEINAGGESFRRDSAWMDDCAAFFRDFTAEKA